MRYDKNSYTEKTGDKWKIWKGKGQDHVYNVNRTKDACKEAMVDCIILGKSYCMQRHDWPACRINGPWAGSSFVQFGLFLHKFMKGLHIMDIVEKGPLVRVKGLNVAKPKPKVKIQDRLIENARKRKEMSARQKKKRELLIEYSMKEKENKNKMKLQQANPRRLTSMRESTVKILLKSKLDRAKHRIQLLRAAATKAREKSKITQDFKII